MLISDFWLQIGDKVQHVKDPGEWGKIASIDWNLIHAGYGVTTCGVIWDGGDVEDIQWTNKLEKV